MSEQFKTSTYILCVFGCFLVTLAGAAITAHNAYVVQQNIDQIQQVQVAQEYALVVGGVAAIEAQRAQTLERDSRKIATNYLTLLSELQKIAEVLGLVTELTHQQHGYIGELKSFLIKNNLPVPAAKFDNVLDKPHLEVPPLDHIPFNETSLRTP